jgi:exodeoxyribonuclease VII large subunit
MAARLVGAMMRRMEERRRHLDHAFRALPHPRRVMEDCARRLDDRSERLENALPSLVERRRTDLDRLVGRLDSALRAVRASEQAAAERSLLRLDQSSQRLAAVMPRLLTDRTGRVENAGKLLESYSYKNVLERGYAVIRDDAGHPVVSAAAVRPGAALAVEFGDGIVHAVAQGQHSASMPKARKTPASDGRQGNLL